jgi:hypothetical protein
MGMFILIMMLTGIVAWLFPPLMAGLKRKFRNLTERRTANIFENQYLESKAFYMYRFRAIPCTTYIDDIDVSKVFSHVQNNYRDRIVDIHQSCYFNHQAARHDFCFKE